MLNKSFLILSLLLFCVYFVNSLETVNKHLVENDKLILLRGIARPSLEWSPWGENLSVDDYKLMKEWGANVVRLSLNQDFWLKDAKLYNDQYQQRVIDQVKMIRSLGMYCILDLHWSDDGHLDTDHAGQQRMADENSIQFWSEVAPMFANDTGVLYELYNEPQLLPWRVWRDGGQYNGKKYVGMKQLYDTVRKSAENVVIMNGIRWGFDLYGVRDLELPTHNVMFGTHPYKDPTRMKKYWNSIFGLLSDKYPVIATEFGEFTCDTNYTREFLDYADEKSIHWTAWGWYKKDCQFPSVISDWNGTPTAVGELVKTSLQNTIKVLDIKSFQTDIENVIEKNNEKKLDLNIIEY